MRSANEGPNACESVRPGAAQCNFLRTQAHDRLEAAAERLAALPAADGRGDTMTTDGQIARALARLGDLRDAAWTAYVRRPRDDGGRYLRLARAVDRLLAKRGAPARTSPGGAGGGGDRAP